MAWHIMELSNSFLPRNGWQAGVPVPKRGWTTEGREFPIFRPALQRLKPPCRFALSMEIRKPSITERILPRPSIGWRKPIFLSEKTGCGRSEEHTSEL